MSTGASGSPPSSSGVSTGSSSSSSSVRTAASGVNSRNNQEPEAGVRQRNPNRSEGTPAINNNNNNNQQPPENNPNGDQNRSYPVVIFTGIFRLLSFPIQVFYETILSLCKFALSIIRVDPAARDPIGEIRSFIQKFESSYGSIHPEFFVGSYQAALSEARKNLKFLLVYLHSDQHQDTPEFIRGVLTHPEVISYINRNNLIFWGASIKSHEGQRVSQALREYSYPFLALIALKDNHRMVVVRKFTGQTSVERFLRSVRVAYPTKLFHASSLIPPSPLISCR